MGELRRGSFTPLQDSTPRYIATNGMRSLAQYLAAKATKTFQKSQGATGGRAGSGPFIDGGCAPGHLLEWASAKNWVAVLRAISWPPPGGWMATDARAQCHHYEKWGTIVWSSSVEVIQPFSLHVSISAASAWIYSGSCSKCCDYNVPCRCCSGVVEVRRPQWVSDIVPVEEEGRWRLMGRGRDQGLFDAVVSFGDLGRLYIRGMCQCFSHVLAHTFLHWPTLS